MAPQRDDTSLESHLIISHAPFTLNCSLNNHICPQQTACTGSCSSRESRTSLERSHPGGRLVLHSTCRLTNKHARGQPASRSILRRPPRRLGQMGRYRHRPTAIQRPVELHAVHENLRPRAEVSHDPRDQDSSPRSPSSCSPPSWPVAPTRPMPSAKNGHCGSTSACSSPSSRSSSAAPSAPSPTIANQTPPNHPN